MSDKKIAIVTGASRGIGMAIATALEDDGFSVLGTATGAAGLERIEEMLGQDNRLTTALPLDLCHAESLQSFLAELDERDLRPAVVVNNAGITRDNLLLRMKDDEWNDVITANLGSVFRLCRHLLKPMLKARYGRIINITSVVGVAGNAGQANYAAAKAGIIGFTKSLAHEVAKRGITVNAVAPGFIDTDMTTKLTDEQKSLALAQIPVGRIGRPDEVAAVVAFLASQAASYITGETIHINGGMHMV